MQKEIGFKSGGKTIVTLKSQLVYIDFPLKQLILQSTALLIAILTQKHGCVPLTRHVFTKFLKILSSEFKKP